MNVLTLNYVFFLLCIIIIIICWVFLHNKKSKKFFDFQRQYFSVGKVNLVVTFWRSAFKIPSSFQIPSKNIKNVGIENAYTNV